MQNLQMYHFGDTYEQCNKKEHIRVDGERGSLCGYEHHLLTSNGNILTLEWAKQNVVPMANCGSVCKKCANIAIKILEKANKDSAVLKHII